MAASSIYRAGGSPTRFPHQFAAGPTHYTTTVEPMHHLRYNSFAIDGHQVPLPSTSPTLMSNNHHSSNNNSNSNMMALNGMRPPPGATLGLLSGNAKSLYMPPPPQEPQQQQQQQQAQYLQYAASSSAVRHSSPIYSSAPSPLFMNPMLAKSYAQHAHMSLVQPTEVLMVSPGVPTPLELSIYEIKQPTGFLHVTVGNQTVEFLDGVANMPHKR